ncbi:MAG: hypothetical protein COB02_10280 [Candidatus Cloacimonadota bacterium]|nr:MAG: hypothetical protein COB02_10280 [Candidatus Cloacimonadota bacterium]
MLNLLKIIVFSIFTFISFSGQDQSKSIKLFGNDFMIKVDQIGGTSVSWSQVKSDVLELFPKSKKIKLNKNELKDLVEKRFKEAGIKYENSVKILSKKVEPHIATKNAEYLEMEIADYLIVGSGDLLIEKYKDYNKSFVLDIKEAQSLHDKYALLMYLEKVVNFLK